MKTEKKKPEHYVNNKDFTAAVAEYVVKIKAAKEAEKTPPRMSEYIGECVYKIATRLSTRPNFINYTYRDEMICDAIENCIQYLGNFNIEKSSNAFAYVTQICYYAFLRRIQKEKKQVFIKQKSIMESDVSLESFQTIDGQYDPALTNTNVEWLKENMNHVNYEPRKSKKKTPTTKKKTGTLEAQMTSKKTTEE
jgi:DNA-directed RNA polymerase specialized sigma24 family protein